MKWRTTNRAPRKFNFPNRVPQPWFPLGWLYMMADDVVPLQLRVPWIHQLAISQQPMILSRHRHLRPYPAQGFTLLMSRYHELDVTRGYGDEYNALMVRVLVNLHLRQSDMSPVDLVMPFRLCLATHGTSE